MGINWKRAKKYGCLNCDTCINYEFISHVSSLIHLLALLQVVDKKCLLLHWTERLNKCQALNKSPTINTNNDNSENDGKASKTSIKLSANRFKIIIQNNGNEPEWWERKRYRRLANNIQSFVDSLKIPNKFNFWFVLCLYIVVMISALLQCETWFIFVQQVLWYHKYCFAM